MEPFLFAGALLFDNKKIAAQAVFRTVWETPNRPSNRNCMVPAFLETSSWKKEIGLSIYKPSSE